MTEQLAPDDEINDGMIAAVRRSCRVFNEMPRAHIYKACRAVLHFLDNERIASTRASTAGSAVGWRCFHCDEYFTDKKLAAEHFGSEIEDPACKLNALEGGILGLLRGAEAELSTYRREDNATSRAFYALGAEHTTALMREEEKGYARGLADGRAHPAHPSATPDTIREALTEARRYLAYLSGETDGFFVGPGMPKDCLAQIDSALAASPWRDIARAPKSGQFLVTHWTPDEPFYSEIELVQAPFLADGRILNLNSGNYSPSGIWTHWTPAPPLPLKPLPSPSKEGR